MWEQQFELSFPVVMSGFIQVRNTYTRTHAHAHKEYEDIEGHKCVLVFYGLHVFSIH